MKTNNNNSYENNHQIANLTERMSSLEIAELCGKQHCDVMRAIRKMEPAWTEVNGSNFALVDYRDRKGELRPCYSLNKAECLFVATKFNDTAPRAQSVHHSCAPSGPRVRT